jgi:hypothetical protein
MPRANRTILAGFPRPSPFKTREEIDHYFCGDRITCLLCGHSFRSLPKHLFEVHNLSGDEYRSMYGLPYSRGLVCGETRDTMADLGSIRFDENKAKMAPAYARQFQTGKEISGRPMQPFVKSERVVYGPSDYEEFIRRVLAGRTMIEVETDADMPTAESVRRLVRLDKDFAAKWAEIVRPVARPGWNKSDRVKAAMAELASQAQELDMGY